LTVNGPSDFSPTCIFDLTFGKTKAMEKLLEASAALYPPEKDGEIGFSRPEM